MIELEARNVLLKGSLRKQLMAWLKRSLRLAQRTGEKEVRVMVERVGGVYRVSAHVEGNGGAVDCSFHKRDLRMAFRGLVQQLVLRLHNRRLQAVAV